MNSERHTDFSWFEELEANANKEINLQANKQIDYTSWAKPVPKRAVRKQQSLLNKIVKFFTI